MTGTKVLVPTDFTVAADQAARIAGRIAGKANATLVLFNVVSKDEERQETLDKLQEIANRLELSNYDTVVLKGKIVPTIVEEASRDEYAFCVMATHGIRGLRQNLFGADALKIAQQCRNPMLIVQENSPIEDFSKILFPYGGHDHFINKINHTRKLSDLFGSSVEIYSIDKPGNKPTTQAQKNIELAKELFQQSNIQFEEIHEDPSMMSMGFARQSLQHAQKSGASLISVMAGSSQEYAHIAKADKETLINNEFGIPVMLSCDLDLG
jgi:nucleotide-binding universal stress UspA family protein